MQAAGAAYYSSLNECALIGNSANGGGGANDCFMQNCLVISNTATFGGGAYGGGMLNCTVVGNSGQLGGGVVVFTMANLTSDSVNNCIIYSNTTLTLGPNYYIDPGGSLNYSCTTPLPTNGTGNITNNPLFVNPAAGLYELQPGSPCVNAGDNAYVSTTTDLAGNPRIAGGTVDMGAYELQVHYVNVANTNSVSPFSSWATAATNIQDAVDAASNYDEVLVTNGIYQYGGRVVPPYSLTNRLVVSKPLFVQSVNGPGATVIQGYQVPTGINGNSAVRCAYLTNGASLIGFTLTNGATRTAGDFTNEQSGGGVLCASTNALLSNCVVTGNSANQSQGGDAVEQGTLDGCVISANSAGGVGNALLNNCAITGNSDGGAGSSVLNDCVVTSNSISGYGGGAIFCTLNNCLLAGNNSYVLPAAGPPFLGGQGGGAAGSTLNNCTVAGNSAQQSGGGTISSSLNNCLVVSNSAPAQANYIGSPTNILSYCCTTPMPTNGLGNITNNPLFVNPAAGDYHLQSNSPCINAGNNAYVMGTTDLDGNPRISGGTVDIGAYEFQNPASLISYAWLEQYGFATDGSADFTDTDGSGMNHWQDWVAGLDPTNPLSVLKISSATNSGTNIVITWQSVTNITYFLQRASNLSVSPAFQPLASNLVGQAGTTSYTDTNAPPPGPYFYRVGVQ
jgi:hypothetical protein